jgi:vitamin K-dependent gamma-carboxylase-like protein
MDPMNPGSSRLRSANDSAFGRIRSALFAPVDISFLVFFRVAFGAVMAWEVLRYFRYGWIASFYIEPRMLFTYYGFDWVRPWAGSGMYVHFAVLGLLAVSILVGYRTRIAAVLFFLGFTYVFLLDVTRYLNHFYLISLLSFLLIFLPAERAFSVDARLNPRLRADTVPAWTLWLLRAQIGIAYIYGGVAKLSPDWLRGEPMRMWLAHRMDFPLIGQFFDREWMVYGFVIGGIVLDLCVVPFLLWPRTRIYAFVAAAAFHLLNARLFDIGVFPWFMLAATLVFFPPDLVRRMVNRLTKPAKRVATRHDPEAVPSNLVLVLLAAWIVVQVLVPLRHLLYPGDVLWTEEGHRFSWRMKLRDKDGDARFLITDPASGREWAVNPRAYLGSRQRDRLAGDPDMILQFSHFLAEEKRKQGFPNVQVHALVMATVNGRGPQLLINPAVDLAKERRTLGHARWIMPLTEPLPRRR